MSVDKKILSDFIAESKRLVDNLLVILAEIEGDFSQVKRLEDYGNQVDRIMGGAQSLAMMAGTEHALNVVSDYTALCKTVSYKAAQISSNPQLYDVCTAVLSDATETLAMLMNRMDESAESLRQSIPSTFLDRLRWVLSQFDSDPSVAEVKQEDKMSQTEIDELMKKLGLDD